MKVTKIKLNKFGQSGADIVAATTDESHTATLGREIPVALDQAMAAFEEHLLRICSYPEAKDKAENEALKENIKIISIRRNGEKIGISGSLTTLNGEKELILNAPDVADEDEYDAYLELDALFEKASQEAISYIINSSCTKGRQFAVKFKDQQVEKAEEAETEEEKLESVIEPPPAEEGLEMEVVSEPMDDSETDFEGF